MGHHHGMQSAVWRITQCWAAGTWTIIFHCFLQVTLSPAIPLDAQPSTETPCTVSQAPEHHSNGCSRSGREGLLLQITGLCHQSVIFQRALAAPWLLRFYWAQQSSPRLKRLTTAGSLGVWPTVCRHHTGVSFIILATGNFYFTEKKT